MLPSELPLFPLPNVVLFPAALLPLHIFEPRYRAMIADALDNERLVGMVMLRPGWEPNYDGSPAIFPVGCAGFITHADKMPDGRYNILLRGIEKFKVVGERFAREGMQRYRMAHIETIDENEKAAPDAAADARRRLEQIIAKRLQRDPEATIPKDIPDADLVYAIAQHLEPLEKQALLECAGLLERCRTLVELLEMKTMAARGGKTRLH